MKVIAEVRANGNRDVVVGAVLEEICAAPQVAFGLVLGGGEDSFESFENTLAGGGRGERLEGGGADAKDVHDDAISAREEVGRQNVDLFRGKGAANFFQQERTIAGGEHELGVTLVGVIDPLDAGGDGG